MKKILLTVFGFKRSKPKTKLGRILRWCELGLTGVLLLWVLLLAYPQPLFGYTFEHEGIRIYFRDPIPEEAGDLLERVQSLINESELSQGQDTFRVFLCNSKWLYMLLYPINPRSFACTYPAIDNIFVAHGDLTDNRCRAFRPDHNERTLVSVVAHEITHVLFRHQFGFWSNLRIPTWLKEGYCDFIAAESSFPASRGDQLITAGKSEPSPSFRYYAYRKMVDYLINVEGYSIKQLVANPPDKQEVLQKTQNWLRINVTEQEASADTDTRTNHRFL